MSSNAEEKTEKQEKEVVAILDAGAQYGKLIDRRVRELNIESVLIPFDSKANELKKYAAIIISGGPSSVYAENAPPFDPLLFSLNIPILAICYGFQLMIHVFNGSISRGQEREDGEFTIDIDGKSKLFTDIESSQIPVLLTHGDIVSAMPTKSAFRVIATSTNGIIAAAENRELNLYGVQFHPEVDLTPDGRLMFRNFLFNICGLKGNYTLNNRMESAIHYIQQKVGLNKKVLCLVSGGVDSSVCCALLQKALQPRAHGKMMDKGYQELLDIASDCKDLLGDRKEKEQIIYPVHIDHGFMRHNESLQVMNALAAIGVKNVHLCEAQKTFMNGTTRINGAETLKLCDTISPEYKRKIIGDVFMKLCDTIVREMENEEMRFEDMLLVQGTLRPDLIESASNIANKGGTAQVIKTHHNDTELVRRLRAEGKVIEPLTDYHKDEVRALGERLGLPKELVWRQPFPGPGLAIRIICCDGTPYTTPHDADIVDKLNKYYATPDISGCLLGFQTVGVQGDGRTYAHCVGLTVHTPSNANANGAGIPWTKLYEMAKNIPRQILNVNRCIFIYGAALKGKQESVTKTYLKQNVVQQLRKCDKIVNDTLFKYNLIHKISQVPVILFPNNFGCNEANARSICIRTFITNDFMTGVPAKVNTDIKEAIVLEMFEEILKIDGIQRVAFDLTPKPPGTTEWE